MSVFEKIVNGELPCFKVYEDEDFLAFLDINPKSKGHTLVIPKKCYETIEDIPDLLLQKLIVKVKELSRLIKIKLNAKGFNICQNNGSVSGQDVPYIHFHIIPRYEGDSVEKLMVSSYEEKEGGFEEVLKKIKIN